MYQHCSWMNALFLVFYNQIDYVNVLNVERDLQILVDANYFLSG